MSYRHCTGFSETEMPSEYYLPGTNLDQVGHVNGSTVERACTRVPWRYENEGEFGIFCSFPASNVLLALV